MRPLTIQEEYLTSMLVTAAEGRWCEKCKVRHRPGTKCPYEGRGKRTPKAPEAPEESSKAPSPAAPTSGKPESGTVAPETVRGLQALVDKGGPHARLTPEQHVELGKRMIDQHKATLPAFVADLGAAAPPTARVKARVKELDSMLGKIIRKPKYASAEDMQDTTGSRIICDSIDEVVNTVNNLKSKYDIIEEDDYIAQPNGNYRSHHLIVRDPKDGQVKEVQVRTENQNTWADWGHKIYKPMNDAQRTALAQNEAEIDDYANKISEYFYQTDMGKPAKKPPCTMVIHKSFGCL